MAEVLRPGAHAVCSSDADDRDVAEPGLEDAEPELIGTGETARRLRVHENTVRNWADAGILPVARVLAGSGFRRFRARDVEALRQRMGSGRG